jgi:hypothetical protein
MPVLLALLLSSGTAPDATFDAFVERPEGRAAFIAAGLDRAPEARRSAGRGGSPMAGTYKVGAGDDFANLTVALAELATRGVSAPVVLELQDDYDSSGETFPLVISSSDPGPSISATNTLTIRPATGVSAAILGNSTTALIYAQGVSGVIVEGTGPRDLRLENTSTGFGSAFIAISANPTPMANLRLRNLEIRCGNIAGPNGTTGALFAGTLLGGPGVFADVEIDNVRFTQCRQAVLLNSNPAQANGVVIEDCDLGGAGADALGDQGIAVGGATNLTIRRNRISGIDGTAPFNDRAIWVTGGASNVIIEANRISGMNSTHPSLWGAWAIGVNGGALTNATIRNNMIWDIRGPGSPLTAGANFQEANNPIGIALWGGMQNAKIYGNTIRLSGATLTSGAAIGIVLNSQFTPSSAVLRNNIVSVGLGPASGAPAAYAIVAQGSAAQILAGSDNNLYHIDAATAGTKAIARLGATDHATLAAWQAAVPGREGASLLADPLLASDSDLHVAGCASPAIGAGADLGADGGGTDIDGDTRALNPDIGADETAFARAPVANPPSLTATPLPGAISLVWSPVAGSGYLVLRVEGSGAVDLPADLAVYSAGDTIGASTVIASTSDSTVLDATVAPTTEYRYAVFAYGDDGTCRRYRRVADATAVATSGGPSEARAWERLE